MSNPLIEELKWRNILNNVTNEDKLDYALKHHKGAYIGFDPSAKSLHLGNYAAIVLLRRFKKFGLKTYALVGGATGMIGDPSGKSSERNLLSMEQVDVNKLAIKNQLQKYAKVDAIFDNYDFYKDINFIDFLRVVGKYINVNYMFEKEIIKSRLETGISFTEFSYTLIQANDFYKLYTEHDIFLQAGGSDQWGNITTGCELIRKKTDDQNHACGLTINLLLKSDGKKFGKSEKGAIFLDASLTSAYEMYQFLINQEDSDVINLLKFLTELSRDEIEHLNQETINNPKLKLAQKALAQTIVTDIHGSEEYESARKISDILFSNADPHLLTKKELATIYEIALAQTLEYKQYNLVELLTTTKIANSNREARELINNNSISINGVKQTDENNTISENDLLQKEYTIIKKGKRNCYIVKWTH